MGLWEWICRAAVAVKRCKHRVKPVTDVYRKGLDASRAAKAQVDGAVKTKAREIHDFLSDDQARDHLTRLLRHVSKNGALFIVRSYGGGPIIDIVSQSIQDRKADSQMERLEELELKVAKLQWELRSRETLGQAEVLGRKTTSKYHNNVHSFDVNTNQLRQETLREYLIQHLAMKILDDMIAHRVRPGRIVKPVPGVDPPFR